jgi:hypothetical protein
MKQTSPEEKLVPSVKQGHAFLLLVGEGYEEGFQRGYLPFLEFT